MGLDKYTTTEDFSSEYRKDQEEATLCYGGKLMLTPNARATLIGERGVSKIRRYDRVHKMGGTSDKKGGGRNAKLLMLEHAQKERSPASRPTKWLKSLTLRREKVPFIKRINVGKERVSNLLRNSIVMALKDYAAIESSKRGVDFSFEAFAKKFARLEFEGEKGSDPRRYRVVHAQRMFWCAAYTDLLFEHFQWSEFLYLDSELNKHITARDNHMRDCARKVELTPIQKQLDELVYKNIDSQVRKLGRYIVERLNIVMNVVKTIAYFDMGKHPDGSPDVSETIHMVKKLLSLEEGYANLDIEKAYSYLALYNDMCLQSKDLGAMVSRADRNHVSKEMASKMDEFVQSFENATEHGRYIWDDRTVADIRRLTDLANREPMTKILSAEILTTVKKIQSRLPNDKHHLAFENPKEMATYLEKSGSKLEEPYTIVVTQDDIAAFDGRIYKKKMNSDPNYALSVQTHKLLRRERELFQTYWTCRSSAAEFTIYTDHYFKQTVDGDTPKERKPAKFAAGDGKNRKASDNTGSSFFRDSLYFNADGTFDAERFDTMSNAKDVDDETIAMVSDKLRASLEPVVSNNMDVEEEETKRLSMSEILKAATESWVDATTVHSMIRSTVRNIIPLACNSLGLIKFENDKNGAFKVILKEFSTEDTQRDATAHKITTQEDVEKMHTAMYEFIALGVKGVFGATSLYSSTLVDEVERREEWGKVTKKKESEAQSRLWGIVDMVRTAVFGDVTASFKKLAKLKQRLKDDTTAFDVYKSSFVCESSVLGGELNENIIREHRYYYGVKSGASEEEEEEEEEAPEIATQVIPTPKQPKSPTLLTIRTPADVTRDSQKNNTPGVLTTQQQPVSPKNTQEASTSQASPNPDMGERARSKVDPVTTTTTTTTTPVVDDTGTTTDFNTPTTPGSTGTTINVKVRLSATDVAAALEGKSKKKDKLSTDVGSTSEETTNFSFKMACIIIGVSVVTITAMYHSTVIADYFRPVGSWLELLQSAFWTFAARAVDMMANIMSSVESAASETLEAYSNIGGEARAFISAQMAGEIYPFPDFLNNVMEWVTETPWAFARGAATMLGAMWFIQYLIPSTNAHPAVAKDSATDGNDSEGGDSEGETRADNGEHFGSRNSFGGKRSVGDNSSDGYTRWAIALISTVLKFKSYILPALIGVYTGSNIGTSIYNGVALFATSVLLDYFAGSIATKILNIVKRVHELSKTGFKLILLLATLFACYNPIGSFISVFVLSMVGFLLQLVVNQTKHILRFFRLCATFGLMYMFLGENSGIWASILATAAIYGPDQLFRYFGAASNSKRPGGHGKDDVQPRKKRRVTKKNSVTTTGGDDKSSNEEPTYQSVEPTVLLDIQITIVSLAKALVESSGDIAVDVPATPETDSGSGYHVNAALAHLYSAVPEKV